MDRQVEREREGGFCLRVTDTEAEKDKKEEIKSSLLSVRNTSMTFIMPVFTVKNVPYKNKRSKKRCCVGAI